MSNMLWSHEAMFIIVLTNGKAPHAAVEIPAQLKSTQLPHKA